MLNPRTLEPTPYLQPVSRLTARQIDWLWQAGLAFGKLAILDGDPGLGKSLLALDLCARLSTGRPFPDGSPAPGPASSIILNGEDGAEDTIRPRLQALGADLDRVFVLQRRSADLPEPMRFPTHLDILDWALSQTGARLVVIDPIMAFLDETVITASDLSMRQALLPLVRLAEQYRCVILLIRHLNKSSGFRALYRGGGSIGIIGACRSAWLVAADPHHPRRRILAQTKNNLGAPAPSLAFEVEAAEGAAATLNWLGPTPWTADQLLAAAASAPAGLPARQRAGDFLKAALAAGPRTSRDLWPLAQKEHLSARTLHRAKKDLNIRSVRLWANGQRLSYWLLPHQSLPPDVPADAIPPDLEPWLAPLREQFPPSTPIDDL
jgi:hypothetical protein